MLLPLQLNNLLSAADSTAPVLSNPTGAATGAFTASGTVDTDEGNGTLYFWATNSASETAAAIKSNGDSQAVSSTGTQNVLVSGLAAETVYYLHYVHDDSTSNESNVVSSAGFTTPEEDKATAGGGRGTVRHFGTGFDYDEPIVVAAREEIKTLKKKKKEVKKDDGKAEAMLLAIEERLRYLYNLIQEKKLAFEKAQENFEYQQTVARQRREKRQRRMKTIMRLLDEN